MIVIFSVNLKMVPTRAPTIVKVVIGQKENEAPYYFLYVIVC